MMIKKFQGMVGLAVVMAGAVVPAMAEKVTPFNGQDLSGWTAVADQDVTGGYTATEPTWFVAEGAIRTTGTPFGYLRTKCADFGDFKLKLEYRWWRPTVRPNSGLFVRLSGEHANFIPTCYENQLCRGSAGDVMGLAGQPIAGVEPNAPYDPSKPLSGIYKSLRKGADVERPFGEWNVMEVEIKDGLLINTVNGTELNRVPVRKDGKGAIALQSEGGAIEFRNIELDLYK